MLCYVLLRKLLGFLLLTQVWVACGAKDNGGIVDNGRRPEDATPPPVNDVPSGTEAPRLHSLAGRYQVLLPESYGEIVGADSHSGSTGGSGTQPGLKASFESSVGEVLFELLADDAELCSDDFERTTGNDIDIYRCSATRVHLVDAEDRIMQVDYAFDQVSDQAGELDGILDSFRLVPEVPE